MYTTRVFLLAAALALVFAQDLTVTPTSWTIYDSQNTWLGTFIKNNAGVSITSVSFKAVSSSPSLGISYSGAATQVNIGSINNGATGSGSFAALGITGSYSVGIYVKYTKSGVAKTFNLTIPLEVIPEDDGSGKRDALAIAPVEETVDESIYDRDIAARDTYVNIVTSSVYADADTATWSALQVSIGSVATTAMTFQVVPASPSVSIGYAYPNGNSLGNGAANSNVYGSFQHLAGCGYYNLNVTVSYKLTGTSTIRKVWKIVLLSVIGAGCEGGDTVGKRGQMIRSDMEGAQANGYNSIPVEYAFGIAVAGVALVAVFSVVGAMIVLRKKAQDTTVVA